MGGTVLFSSGRKPRMHMQFQAAIIKRKDKVLGLITVLVCRKTSCALHERSVQLRLFL